MTTKRIRCSCGRVYDPVKRPACPDCGAPHVAAAPAPEAIKETPPVSPPSSIETKPVPRPPVVSPQIVAIGAGILLLLIIVLALSRCGRKPAKPEPMPTPVSGASPSPALTPTPVPSLPTAAPTAPVIPPPTASPLPTSNGASSGLTSDLAGALASAAPGATIKLPPGIYPGGLVLTKAVRIVGGMGQVFIQSEGRECLSVRAAGVAVQNVQFICNGIGQLPAISVADGAGLELDGCKITSNTEAGVTVAGKASIKAIGSSFVAVTGRAMWLDQKARGNFTQCSFAQSHLGLELANGASAELHSCAFDADGGNDGDGAIAFAGDGTTFTADDCHFSNNNAGVGAAKGATLTISKSSFKGNGLRRVKAEPSGSSSWPPVRGAGSRTTPSKAIDKACRSAAPPKSRTANLPGMARKTPTSILAPKPLTSMGKARSPRCVTA
ncbi:MAG: right-handed parallel beta-helix repeat-containing protein [Chthoniobacterales bacterium]|nr:right-handed parallel beta-helix repeat-containing protein [Chthoniobacterales bacterium]